VGGGLEPRLARLIAAAPRAAAVGVVADISAELAAARLVIAPIWQGGGTRIKVAEALAAARPVVGASLGVAGIGFVDGRHGLVADEPAELADAAVAVLGDAQLASSLARQGRMHARTLVWRRTLARATELYAQWVEEAGSRGREPRRPATSRYTST
jgi:glycosyltransferase involved in cell wall biosynthesis